MNLICDSELFDRLDPRDVSIYLRSRNWTIIQEIPGAVIFGFKDEKRTEEVLLPLDRQFRDFSLRIRQAVSVIAEVERRSQLAIFREIEEAAFDIVEIAVAKKAGFTNIDQGIALLHQGRELILSVACSADEKSPLFGSRRSVKAKYFMESLRVHWAEDDQSRIRILAEVPRWMLEVPFSADSTPYERQVTSTLTAALDATNSWRESPIGVDSEEDLLYLVEQGVSANFFESLARLSSQAEDGAVSIRVKFSPFVSTSQEWKSRQFAIDSDFMPLLISAASGLRAEAQKRLSTQTSVRGEIVVLRRPTQSKSGHVMLEERLGFSRTRKVSIELDETNYRIAVDAHKARKPIVVTGLLERKGRRWVLKNPLKFEIVQ